MRVYCKATRFGDIRRTFTVSMYRLYLRAIACCGAMHRRRTRHFSPSNMKRPAALLADPARLRHPPPGFVCGEKIATNAEEEEAEHVGAVSFYCTLPSSSQKLTFSCRGRSVGALLSTESSVDDNDLDEAAAYEAVDPFLFNEDYTPAGKTGFQIWSGTRLLIECLVWPPPPAAAATASVASVTQKNPSRCEERLSHYRQMIVDENANVLELGSGVAVVGTTLAAVGANVLLTDLPTLVENAVWPNIGRNKHHNNTERSNACSTDRECPAWLADSGAVPIGHGWAAATALDWTRPTSTQLTTEQMGGIELIVASDCVWLVSMLDALLDTVGAVFAAAGGGEAAGAATRKQSPAFLMSFQRRDASGGDDSPLFTTVDRVLESVQERGWEFDCLAWRPVTLDDGEGEKEVFVFEIKSAA